MTDFVQIIKGNALVPDFIQYLPLICHRDDQSVASDHMVRCGSLIIDQSVASDHMVRCGSLIIELSKFTFKYEPTLLTYKLIC